MMGVSTSPCKNNIRPLKIMGVKKNARTYAVCALCFEIESRRPPTFTLNCRQ